LEAPRGNRYAPACGMLVMMMNVHVTRELVERLQQVFNTAAHVVSDTWKFDRGLSRIMHTELHWLDVPERINYKLGMLMYRRQHNKAPLYLMDHCTSVSNVACRQRLRSASSHEVCVQRHRLSTYGRRAFAVADPTVWKSLPRTCMIRKFQRTVTDSLCRYFYLCSTSVFSALKVFYENALYKSTFDI